jgi:hypothetical protein
LLAVRAREARQRGFRFLHVDASLESQPILAKHGFRVPATVLWLVGFSRPEIVEGVNHEK